MPRARLRTSWVPAATIASDVGNSTAAPIPARACPVHSTPIDRLFDPAAAGVSTLTTSPTAMRALPPISSRFRPKRSPRTPVVSSSRVIGTRNASEIHVSCDDVVCRSCWNRPLSTAGIASPTCATRTANVVATCVPRVRVGVWTAGLAGGASVGAVMGGWPPVLVGGGRADRSVIRDPGHTYGSSGDRKGGPTRCRGDPDTRVVCATERTRTRRRGRPGRPGRARRWPRAGRRA